MAHELETNKSIDNQLEVTAINGVVTIWKCIQDIMSSPEVVSELEGQDLEGLMDDDYIDIIKTLSFVEQIKLVVITREETIL